MTVAPVLTVTLNPAIDLHLAVAAWPRGDVGRAIQTRRAAGGKGVNVSRVLGELGIASEAFCLVGRSPDRDVFLSLLEGLPLSIKTLEIAGSLRTNVTVTCAGDRRRLKVNQPGPAVSMTAWRAIERAIGELLPGRRWLVLSGALPPGAPAEGYARLARRAHRQGVRVALDCAGEALLAALPERPELVKPNREELEETLGLACRTRRDVLRAAEALRQRGADWLIVSGGGAECLGMTEAGAWRARPPKVAVDHPMGGGDSLLAGFLVGVLHGRDFAEALRLGVAAGTATAMRPNTLLCRRADVKALQSQVELTRV